ncbi:SulA-like SOS-response cell division inhibitor [Idiomarina xiamenensis]|uniref:SulA-like SOS-response cell division inhibitor n=1 Tax=Idiomarina xiamenensis 10-D-4 TaxID=740709 RepID=K2JXN0_9GAMM|nr:SulA-like SOS-response cell division inhibitor [Idiomarina xiamenensis]EKE79402.1 SulA-like SOS-response cell division inhibitor [Idiomarina xiamenensis 10-D-4]
MPHALNELMRRGWLWQGQAESQTDVVSTGYAELDNALHGGWAKAALHELQIEQPFQYELQLLQSSLRWAQQQPQAIAWLNPPAQPHAHGLASYDLADCRHVVINATPQDALWAYEQCLQSGSFALVLGWLEQLDGSAVRRLLLAAQKHPQLAFVLTRQQQLDARAYSTRLRLRGHRVAQQPMLSISVLKRRQGWPLAAFDCAIKPRVEWRSRRQPSARILAGRW